MYIYSPYVVMHAISEDKVAEYRSIMHQADFYYYRFQLRGGSFFGDILSTLGANGKTWNFDFVVIIVYYEKIGRMLNPHVPTFRPDLSTRLKYIAEKPVHAKL